MFYKPFIGKSNTEVFHHLPSGSFKDDSTYIEFILPVNYTEILLSRKKTSHVSFGRSLIAQNTAWETSPTGVSPSGAEATLSHPQTQQCLPLEGPVIVDE